MPSLGSPRYVLFTNFRRNGTRVSTPVWFAPHGDTWVFSTAPDAGKVKRLRNNPAAEIAASDVRGRVKEGSPTFTGTARLLDATETAAAERALAAKYGLQWKALRLSERVRNLVGIKADAAYISVTLD
ncbi:MAG: PPOX class F420-dependent oxidoreductase [Acidimicrobiales bacterium]